MLTKQSREDLKWAMRASLLEQAGQIQEKEARQFVKEFVLNEATYEQLLNLTYNPYRDDVYLESEKLETVAKTFIEESLAGKSEGKAIALLESFVQEREKAISDKNLPPAVKQMLANKKAADSGRPNMGHTAFTAPTNFPESEPSVNPNLAAASTPEYMKQHPVERPGMLRRGYEATKGAGSTALQHVGRHKLGYGLGAAGVAAAGVGAYLIYRKMRAAGKDKRQAALAAANASTDSEERNKWMSKAQIA